MSVCASVYGFWEGQKWISGDDAAATDIKWVSEWYRSLTAHQHQTGHTVPKTGINCLMSLKLLQSKNCTVESIRYQAKSEQNVRQDLIPRVRHRRRLLSCIPTYSWPELLFYIVAIMLLCKEGLAAGVIGYLPIHDPCSAISFSLLMPPGPLVYVMDLADRIIYKVCPFVAGGIFIGSMYWTAVTYGAVTVMQVRWLCYISLKLLFCLWCSG